MRAGTPEACEFSYVSCVCERVAAVPTQLFQPVPFQPPGEMAKKKKAPEEEAPKKGKKKAAAKK